MSFCPKVGMGLIESSSESSVPVHVRPPPREGPTSLCALATSDGCYRGQTANTREGVLQVGPGRDRAKSRARVFSACVCVVCRVSRFAGLACMLGLSLLAYLPPARWS